MSPEWVTALATLGTFVVIAASAAAALFQLRHMRGSNQIIALTEVRETIESADFQDAERFINDLSNRFDDPAVRGALSTTYFPSEYQPVRYVANFFESFGAFVKNGIIDQNLACDLWGGVVERNWDALRPVIVSQRAALGTHALGENFEYMASVSKAFIAKHGGGVYPKNMQRLPLPEPWPESTKNREP